MTIRAGVAMTAATALGVALGLSVPLALPSPPVDTVTVAGRDESPQNDLDEPVDDAVPTRSLVEHLAHRPVPPVAVTAAAPVPAQVEQSQAEGGRWRDRALPDGPSPVGALGIPERLLLAYRAAAAGYGSSCGLRWEVLAAVGRVESGHADGGRVHPDGVTWRPILGPVLDGRGVAAISDSDGGVLDGDRVWDRAVGPLQFLPATWAWVGVDGDRDGTRDPHDVDDAAASAARYLCAHGGDLSDPEQLRRALLRYNNSTAYVETVLAWAEAYGERAEATPTPSAPPPTAEPLPTPTATPSVQPAPLEEPSPSPSPTAEPSSTPEPTEEPTPTADPTPTLDPTPTAEPTPTADPTTQPSPEPTAEASASPLSSPLSSPLTSPSASPAP